MTGHVTKTHMIGHRKIKTQNRANQIGSFDSQFETYKMAEMEQTRSDWTVIVSEKWALPIILTPFQALKLTLERFLP